MGNFPLFQLFERSVVAVSVRHAASSRERFPKSPSFHASEFYKKLDLVPSQNCGHLGMDVFPNSSESHPHAQKATGPMSARARPCEGHRWPDGLLRIGTQMNGECDHLCLHLSFSSGHVIARVVECTQFLQMNNLLAVSHSYKNHCDKK